MNGPLDQWLGYRDLLPLKVDALSAEPTAAALEHWHDQNLRTLHAIAVLDERHRGGESGGALEAEVERLHQKIDVVLELLGAVLRAGRAGAASTPLRLSREGLSWPADERSPPAGSLVLAAVELHACAPFALCWPAESLGIHDGEVCARFREMSEAMGAALEKLVFTRHRRSVASLRLPAGAGVPSGPPRQ